MTDQAKAKKPNPRSEHVLKKPITVRGVEQPEGAKVILKQSTAAALKASGHI